MAEISQNKNTLFDYDVYVQGTYTGLFGKGIEYNSVLEMSYEAIADATSEPVEEGGFASFYKTFEPKEAYRLAQRLEIHYTPKHGSWLDMAEIELSALTTQCLLGVRIPDIDALNEELSAWDSARNAGQKGISWQFTKEDARIKLKHLYPEIKF